MNIPEHKPVIHRKCGKRIPDKGERIKGGKKNVKGERVCTCGHEHNTVFSSVPQPPDLEFYDKFNK